MSRPRREPFVILHDTDPAVGSVASQKLQPKASWLPANVTGLCVVPCPPVTVREALVNSARHSSKSLPLLVFTLLRVPLQPKQMELFRPPKEPRNPPNSGFSHLSYTDLIFTSLGRSLVGSGRSVHTAEQEPPP